MLSHCCARCGRNLDASSRSFSALARLWVAACPRCGFAVAWMPRRAREGARVWARLRALNIRLGIAFSAAQIAALLLVVALGMHLDRPQTFSLSHPTLVLLAACAAILTSASAVALAPARPAATAALVSWAVLVVPTAAVICAVLSIGMGRLQLARSFETLGKAAPNLLTAGTLCVVASIALAPILAAAYEGVRRGHARRDRAAKRFSIGSPLGVPT
ncbi:MAG: hypothetical protein LW636_07450 [Planctomycetaceae bacterium]|nr:hypothetical protein [Planctomycetaceae bacterium]